MRSGAAAAPWIQRAESAWRSAACGWALRRRPSARAASSSAPAWARASKPARSLLSVRTVSSPMPALASPDRTLGLLPICVRRRRRARVAAEVWRGAFLARRDDPAADVAGAREELEQLVALAPADGAGERLQVLGEAAEGLQHRVLVGQEDVAPHGRVGGGDAGEVAKAPGGVLHHLAAGDALEVGGRAHDVV